MIGTEFYYNEISSTEYGVSLVRLSAGFTPSPFLANKSIIEEKIAGRDKPYFFGVDKSPLELTVVLCCVDDVWTIEKRRQIARWLDTDQYCPLYSSNDPYKVYYCQYTGGIELNENANMQGYIEVTMRCDSPYAYSPVLIEEYDFSSTSSNTFTLEIDGDDDVKPEVTITKVGAGDISIINTSDANIPEFKFTDLADQEVVYIDNELEVIQTSLNDIYRYSNFNDNFMVLTRGINNLKVTGKCLLTIKWQCKILG